MNYQPVTTENKANKSAGPKEANHNPGTQGANDTGHSDKDAEPAQEYFVMPSWSSYTSTLKGSETKHGGEKPNEDTGVKTRKELVDQTHQIFLEELEQLKRQEKEANDAAEALRNHSTEDTEELLLQADDSEIPALEDIYDTPDHGIFTNASYDDEGAVADFTNLDSSVNVSPIPTSRIHFIHPTSQILGDLKLAVQTRSKVNKGSTHTL
ncbi:hypothetical protein Tco_1380405, partial [Tanacetum coccineum]